MKLYHFNPNNWGAEYYVMAENKIKALEYLLKYFQNLIDTLERSDYNNYIIESTKANIKMWEIVNPEDPKTFPEPFTLDEFEAGHIIESELA